MKTLLKSLLSIIISSFIFSNNLAQSLSSSSNNNCINAEFLIVSPPSNCDNYNYNVEVSIENNSNDLPIDCEENVLADVFYKIIVPTSGKILISVNKQIGLSIYESCDQNEIFCNNYIFRTLLIDNLPPDEEVILQFFQDYNPTDFELCIEDAQSSENNLCSNAKAINLQYFCEEMIPVTNKYNNLNLMPDCDQYAMADAFYQTKVPASGKIQIVLNPLRDNYISNIGLSIYDECNGNQLLCKENIINMEVIENLPPESSILLQFFQENPNNFEFCLREGIPDSNDDCVQAELIEVGDCFENIIKVVNSLNTGENNSTCVSNEVDIFYKFIVPGNGEVRLSLIQSKSNRRVDAAIFSSCNSEELYCRTYFGEERISDLPAGETVILKLSQNTNSFDPFSFCVGAVAPSSNNNCNNARSVEVNANGACETNITQFRILYNTGDKLPSCFEGGVIDSYYEFIVPQSGTVKIKTNTGESPSNSVSYAIYRSCDGSELHCNNNKAYGEENIGNLPIGEKVILQIIKLNPFYLSSFCIEEAIPTINNNCSNAEMLNVFANSSCSYETNFEGAILVDNQDNTLNLATGCNQDMTADIFYRFTVPNSGNIQLTTNVYLDYSLFKSCNEEPFFCEGFDNGGVITGLTPGEIILIQFSQRSPYAFSVCLNDAPPSSNNFCINAEYIEVSDFTPYQSFEYPFTAYNGNNTLQKSPSCNPNAIADSFFEFNAPESGQVKVETRGNGSQGIAIYETCNGVEVYCESFVHDTGIIRNLIPGELYVLQYYEDRDPSFNTFNIYDAPKSNNDLCVDAIPLPILQPGECVTTKVELNLVNNTASIMPPCNINNADAFYEIVVPESGKLYYESSNVSTNISLYKGCKGENIYCSDNDGDHLIENLTPGDTLVLQIFNAFLRSSTIEFCLSDQIKNDNCASPKILCSSPESGTLFSASEQAQYFETSCDYYDGYSTWYSFETNDSGNPISIQFARKDCSNGNDRIKFALLSGNCNSGFSEISCSTVNGTQNSTSIDLENPMQNQTYFIQIKAENESTSCNYEIQLLNGIENDCCKLDYEINTWCYNQNENIYFADIIMNNLGGNVSGYILNDTQTISSLGITTIGPITNGNQTITLQGIDNSECIFIDDVNFNCETCPAEIVHSNAIVVQQNNFQAFQKINSNIKIINNTNVNYLAGNTITLMQGFEVDKYSNFFASIGNCE